MSHLPLPRTGLQGERDICTGVPERRVVASSLAWLVTRQNQRLGFHVSDTRAHEASLLNEKVTQT